MLLAFGRDKEQSLFLCHTLPHCANVENILVSESYPTETHGFIISRKNPSGGSGVLMLNLTLTLVFFAWMIKSLPASVADTETL